MNRNRRIGFLGMIGLALLAAPPLSRPVWSQATCNGFISIAYPPDTAVDTTRIRLTISTGPINGGTKLRVNQVGFYLDCRNKGCSNNFFQNCNLDSDCAAGKTCKTLGTACADDGNVMSYVGNLSSTCGVTWTPSFSSGGNQVIFSASPQLQILANSAGCALEFDVAKVAMQSNDTTPELVEQVAGFTNAMCDNGANSSNAQSGFLAIGNNQQIGEAPAPAMSEAGLAVSAAVLAWYGRRRARRRAASAPQ